MDAKTANMSSKRVKQLRFSWERNEETYLQENVKEILEVLQPQTQQLQSLAVRGYTDAYFPQWMSSSSLNTLTGLRLENCKSCLHIPDLGKLPSLKFLRVSDMSHVKYLSEHSCNGGVAEGFPAIEYLMLQNLPNLVSLSREDRDNMFSYLSTLKITECPVMLELPSLPSLNCLSILGKCNHHLLSSIHKQHTLEKLSFNNHKELSCFPDGMLRDLTSLKILDINGLSKLEQLPAEIHGCENLKSLPDELSHGLHSLKKLHITKCEKFKLSEIFQYLTCLEELRIQGCPEIEGLHEALQHMTALRLLTLCDLPNLASLPDWLGNLGLLNQLTISLCPKLTCLPMSIQHLTSLEHLRIYGCSELGKRCKENAGEDWHKIVHIQHIQVHDGGITFGGEGGSYQSYGFRF